MKKTTATVFLFVSAFTFLPASFVSSSRANTHTVATYECIGIYYKADFSGECQVRYRQKGLDPWRMGLDLVYDARDGEDRGRLVNLTADTGYEIELVLDGSKERLQARTRADRFPTGLVTRLENGTRREPLLIDTSGTPDAYHLVVAADHATIDVMNAAEYNIVIDADYVVVRGLELKNAARHGILVQSGRHDVVIEDCRITFWGRVGGPVTYGNIGNMDSAIYANRGAGRLTIQRNLIEDPRGGSNDWDDGHPAGPRD